MPTQRSDHRDTRGRTSPYWVSGPGEGVVVPGMKEREQLDAWRPELPGLRLPPLGRGRVKLRVLEICSGSGSVGAATAAAARELGVHDVEVFSVDGKPGTRATRKVDILTYDWAEDEELKRFMLPPAEGDAATCIYYAHASPPCGPYSSMSARYRGRLSARDLLWGDSVVQRCLDLMAFFRPHYWTLESRGPPGLDTRPFMRGLEAQRSTVNYCRYGKHRWKATSIWTNVASWRPEPQCVPSNRCAHFQEHGAHLDRVQAAKHTDADYAALPEALVCAWTRAALAPMLQGRQG